MEAAIRVMPGDAERLGELSKLIGRLSEASVVDPAWENRKSAVIGMRRTIRGRMKVPF
jgi:hypothetical protein